MKLSNERILNDSAKLVQLTQKELPIKASYAIAKNMAKLDGELKTYNSEREKLIEKYSEKDENGKPIITGEGNQVQLQKDLVAEWSKDIKDLLAIENEVDIHQFNINDLNGLSMTPAELMLIDYMIQE